ncbi:MAG: hypothetical protein FWG50_08860 [Kiritimatiellaeota bacterium]|nr:hypothetical protein [Kiritimatiellota bacterium]
MSFSSNRSVPAVLMRALFLLLLGVLGITLTGCVSGPLDDDNAGVGRGYSSSRASDREWK